MLPRSSRICLAAAVSLALLVAPALAQDVGEKAGEPETMTDAGPRFELLRQGDGYVRLDRQTGEMSYCAVRDANLTCRLAGEEREAWLRQVDDLEDRILRLEERLEGLSPDAGAGEETREGTKREDPSRESPELSPSQEREFDEAVEFAERALRRFFDVVKELRAQIEEESPDTR